MKNSSFLGKEPPHYRGSLWAIGRQLRATYLDRGSQRRLSILKRHLFHILISAVFVYNTDDNCRVVWTNDATKQKIFHRIFILSTFPYFSFQTRKNSYKTLHFSVTTLKNYKSILIRFENPNSSIEHQICDISRTTTEKLLSNEAELLEDIQRLRNNKELKTRENFAKLEQSIFYISSQNPKLDLNKFLILLYCSFQVNHRSAHKALKRWTEIRRNLKEIEQINEFRNQLDLITFPLALGRHGYQPSFKNLDLKEVEGHLAKLIVSLKRLEVEPFLNSGTLLGYYRDGQPIAHDDDFDLGILVAGVTEDQVATSWHHFLKRLNSEYEVINKGSFVAVKLPNNIQVDLFLAFIIKERLYVHPYCWGDVCDHTLLPLGQLRIRGQIFPIPSKTEVLLAVNYGENWRIPDPFWRFDYIKSKRRFGKFLKKIKSN